MYTTSETLLGRLRDPKQQQAWARFVELYTPLLLFWARRHGLEGEDRDDLVQDIFATLVTKLPGFRYERQGSFRSWLRTVAVNKMTDRLRRRKLPIAREDELSAVEAPRNADPFEEEEYRTYLVRRALEVMQAEFEPATWNACWEFVVAGKSASQVASELGTTENAVWIAKCRVIRRLRQELADFLD